MTGSFIFLSDILILFFAKITSHFMKDILKEDLK